MKIVLIYQGGGFIPCVPARDLTAADVKRFGLDIDILVESPLYEKPKPPKQKVDKEVTDG